MTYPLALWLIVPLGVSVACAEADLDRAKLGSAHPLFLLRDADLIVAGTITSIKDAEISDLSFSGRTWHIQWRVATIAADTVFKGPEGENHTLEMRYYVLTPHETQHPETRHRPQDQNLEANKRYLLIAKRNQAKQYELIPYPDTSLHLDAKGAEPPNGQDMRELLLAELSRAIRSKDIWTAINALRFADKIYGGDETFLAAVRNMAKNENAYTGLKAKEVLAEHNDFDTLQEVVRLSASPQQPDRETDDDEIAPYLRDTVPNEKTLPLLLQIAQSSHVAVRYGAIVALSNLRDVRVVPAIVAGLQSKNRIFGTQLKVTQALQKIVPLKGEPLCRRPVSTLLRPSPLKAG